jgi:hypothetical protein
MAERFKKTWLGGGAKSTDGYVVLFNSRSSIEYRDREGKVIVSAEGLTIPHTIAIYPDDMRLSSLGGKQVEDEARRLRILERVHKAAAFRGLKLV